MTFEQGQDPNEHYWLYFTTLNEEKVTLEVGMFAFNLCPCVPAQRYFEHIPVPNPPDSAPAYFRSHEKARTVLDIVTTAQEFTVLRNTALQAAIASSSGIDWQAIYEFMGEVSRDAQLWSKEGWPQEPSVSVEADLGEMVGKPADYDEGRLVEVD